MSRILLFGCPSSTKWAPTKTCGTWKLYGKYSAAIALGGLANRTMKMAQALDIAILMLRSFFDFGLYVPLILWGHHEHVSARPLLVKKPCLCWIARNSQYQRPWTLLFGRFQRCTSLMRGALRPAKLKGWWLLTRDLRKFHWSK